MAKKLFSLFRAWPFKNIPAENREKERHRRVVLTALASVGAKGINVLTLLVSVPLAIRYLGTERFGLWMTISSVIAILSFADLGIGNGLLNAVSEAHGKEDRARAQKYVSSAFFMLSGVAAVFALLFGFAYSRLPWDSIFNVKSALAISEAGPSMAVFVGCFLLNIPLGIVQRIQIGYQEGYINSLWQGAGNALGLAGVLLAIYLELGLPWIVLAFAGSPLLAALANSLFQFKYKRPWLLPAWSHVDGAAVRRILKMGALFFVLQAAVAVAFSSDNIVIAQLLGPAAVSEYAIAMRVFSFAPMFLGYFLMPLWPAYGESIARGDVKWTKKTLVRSLKLSFSVTVLYSLLLVIFGRQIIKLWAGSEVMPSMLLLLGLGVWTVFGTLGNAVAMFLNGCNKIGFQAVTGSLMAIAALLAKIVFGKAMGLPGIIWGTLIAYAVFVILPFGIYLPRLFRNMGLRRQDSEC